MDAPAYKEVSGCRPPPSTPDYTYMGRYWKPTTTKKRHRPISNL